MDTPGLYSQKMSNSEVVMVLQLCPFWGKNSYLSTEPLIKVLQLVCFKETLTNFKTIQTTFEEQLFFFFFMNIDPQDIFTILIDTVRKSRTCNYFSACLF